VRTTGRNAQVYVAVYDKARNETTYGDRLFRPLVTVPGRHGRCDYQAAVACDPDAPRLYGAENTTLLYRDDNAPRCCPATRVRLADLLSRCPILAAQIYRRREAEEAARSPSLVERVFGEAAE
jgi:hypothetical protein